MKCIAFFKYKNYKSKNIYINLAIFLVIAFLLLNSNVLIISISNSIDIFLVKLIPSLFPYLLITELLINSGKIHTLAYGIDTFISKLFHIPNQVASTVIVGFLLGYPNAAKCILKQYKTNLIDSKTSTKLVSFTSNANMSFIIATIGIGMFKSIEIGIILLISHILSSIIIRIIFSTII